MGGIGPEGWVVTGAAALVQGLLLGPSLEPLLGQEQT